MKRLSTVASLLVLTTLIAAAQPGQFRIEMAVVGIRARRGYYAARDSR